ncbi:hypothetical protein LTR53_015724, partial [Teratosphaeriaceae sp. CCFEE 6253]
MTSPSDSCIDALAARVAIKKDDDIGFISIPGIEAVPESQQIGSLQESRVWRTHKLIPFPTHLADFLFSRQRLVSGHLDADAIRSRLQSITPPPLIGEERDEESHLLEARARQDLESEGCAPCYPPHLEVPVRHPPEEYRQIIEYWQSLGFTDDVVLCAQRSDWRKFRHYQRLQRQYYRKEPFGLLEAEVRERRRRNGLDDDVQLLPDCGSRVGNRIGSSSRTFISNFGSDRRRIGRSCEINWRKLERSLVIEVRKARDAQHGTSWASRKSW